MKTKNKLLTLAGALITCAGINSAIGQSTGNNAYNATWYLGWSTSQNLPFKLAGTQYMTLTTAGDLNLNTAARRYQIAGNNVLWHNGNTANIFVGVGAGTSNSTGAQNTYIGKDAGKTNTTASGNTAVGCAALTKNIGFGNTALGDSALASLTYSQGASMEQNTAVGYLALKSYVYSIGSYPNVAVGAKALYMNYIGGANVAIGCNALSSNYSGRENTGVGANVMSDNVYGDYNTAMGDEALGHNKNGSRNTAIGSETMANCTGDYNTGIGMWAGLGSGANSSSLYSNNCFFGYQSGYLCTTGGDNVFCGYQSGAANTTGNKNVFSGSQAGYNNTSGVSNVFSGYQAGYSATTGSNNIFTGYQSGYSNIAGAGNIFTGYQAGYSNGSGKNNIFLGEQSGYSSTTSAGDIFIGRLSGYSNTIGDGNVFLGQYAGYSNTTGSNNFCLGYSADVGAGNLNNCGAIGFNTVVTASNKIFMGDGNLLGCYNFTGIWGSYSDARFKTNVKEDVKGLEFIKKLRPVTYNLDTKKLTEFISKNMPESTRSAFVDKDFTESTKRVHSGFLAQEVEKASVDCGFTSSIVSKPSNDNDPYALSYAEFVVPLVKAVQEQQKMIEDLKTEVASLKTALTGAQHIDLNNSNQPILFQNEPNPFDGSTLIRYFIPENINNAYVVFYDEVGKEVNRNTIKEKGFGKIEVNTENLAAGIYTYSIYVDGKSMDTKKMLKK
jgi:trimeric autotransporter adhesin